MTCRRADSTEVIGHALAAKAAGAGFRTIAAALDRPVSTVRAWLRRANERHAIFLHRQAVQHCRQLDARLLIRPAPQPTLLGQALNLLAGDRRYCLWIEAQLQGVVGHGLDRAQTMRGGRGAASTQQSEGGSQDSGNEMTFHDESPKVVK